MQSFVCGECGGLVELREPKDDFRTIRKNGDLITLPIPTHILIPKCGRCGETYFGQSDSDRVEEALNFALKGES